MAGGGNGSVLRVARLLRLSRMARMARLLRAMPELMIMIKGMMAACRSVFFTLILLGIIIYIFAIAFTQLCGGSEVGERYFSDVPSSMMNLLIYGTLMDSIGQMINDCSRDSIPVLILIFLFVLLASLTVMNMLIGVLCEVVSAVAATEKEEMLVTYVHEKLLKVVSLLDADGGGTISKKEFTQILENVDAVRCLQDVGVDVIGLVDFADFIFEDESGATDDPIELSFPKFMEVVLQLRGSNNATVKDIVDFRKYMRISQNSMRYSLTKMENDIHTIAAHIVRDVDAAVQKELSSISKAILEEHAEIMDANYEEKISDDKIDISFDKHAKTDSARTSKASRRPKEMKKLSIESKDSSDSSEGKRLSFPALPLYASPKEASIQPMAPQSSEPEPFLRESVQPDLSEFDNYFDEGQAVFDESINDISLQGAWFRIEQNGVPTIHLKPALTGKGTSRDAANVDFEARLCAAHKAFGHVAPDNEFSPMRGAAPGRSTQRKTATELAAFAQAESGKDDRSQPKAALGFHAHAGQSTTYDKAFPFQERLDSSSHHRSLPL